MDGWTRLVRSVPRVARVAGASASLLGAASGCGSGGALAGAAEEGPAQNGSGPELGEIDPAPARGISIVEVELNQGVATVIGAGGEWIDPAARERALIAGRDAALRIHYEVDDSDWTGREIEARVTLTHADGTVSELSATQLVETSSSVTGAPFLVPLAAEAGQTEPGTQIAVELWDLYSGLGDHLAQGDWRSPRAGQAEIGFEPVALQLKLVIVPIDYTDGPPALDDATLAALLDNLYEHNPVVDLLWDLHPPLAFEGQLASLGALLPTLASLREDEAADPNTYYHALIDVGSQSLGGVFGISAFADATPEGAGDRVSATVLWSPGPSKAIETFTHETGHAQGLAHVVCPNATAAEPDPSYPYADGLLGAWGYGVRSGRVFDPATSYDYMSYCQPSFVSSWSWDRTLARIETLTAWDFEGQAPSGEGDTRRRRVVGVLDADGAGQWAIVNGAAGAAQPPATATATTAWFEFEVDGVRREVAASLRSLSDGRTRWVSAPLPADLDDLVFVEAGRRETIVDAQLRRTSPSTWRPHFSRYEP